MAMAAAVAMAILAMVGNGWPSRMWLPTVVSQGNRFGLAWLKGPMADHGQPQAMVMAVSHACTLMLGNPGFIIIVFLEHT